SSRGLGDVYKRQDTDENGFEVEVFEETEIWGRECSIRGSEFYQAHKQGIKLAIMFLIKPYEYELQEKLKYEGNIYNIERTYKKDTENLELICSRAE
ncbi:phage head closure protein, partial [Clostridium perfringens]|uniref:phage head closure protein n=1 Tax=Clostridium perfringens TaxID=1502 RepID=UPI00232CF3C3